jgi:macrodomain Ter protein organizer (MatP/YcbG family)
MNINELINKNTEKIEIFIIILEHLKNEFNNKLNINIHKVISAFFLKIFNNEDIETSKKKLLLDIKEKKLKLLYYINLNKKITIEKIKYNVIKHEEKKEYTINFDIKYNQFENVNIYKIIPEYIFNKIHNINNKKKEKYLFFFYIIVGFDTGQFWGLHPYIYDFINKNYTNSIECFASPFNNNIENYFSLLCPIDKFYGSKGNFFEEFLKVNYDVYVINPPFVDTIILKVFDMVEEKLKHNHVQIFLYIPQWDDIFLPWYKTISNKYITFLCKLNKNDSIVYDYIAAKSLKATFGTYFIYINNYVHNFLE